MLHDSQPLSLDTTPTSADPIRVCIIGPQSGQRRWTNRSRRRRCASLGTPRHLPDTRRVQPAP
uniref:Uncharacterized protein n=2 Tax=Oryza TaxID=4527 RepID=A0A0D3ERK8_9ORYZ